jgi:hypothetical protein
MSEEIYRRRIHHALDVEPADPRLASRVFASLPAEFPKVPAHPNLRWAPAIIVVIVAVAIVASLLYAGGLANRQPSPAGVNLNCSLPVTSEDGSRSGFISMPSGDFTPAPSGVGRTSYDAALDRWLTVPPNQVSPDGRQYVTERHITDITTGQSTSAPVTGTILLWDASGIYYRSGQGYTGWELWLYDPSTGRRQQLSGPGPEAMEWDLIAGGAAWGEKSGAYNVVVRFDLRTHIETTWYQAPFVGTFHGTLWIVGADADGHPIVLIGHYVLLGQSSDVVIDRLLVAVSPTKTVDLGTVAPDDYVTVTATPDLTGTWIWKAGGLWFYTRSGRLIKTPFNGATWASVRVAGPCV